MHGVRGGPERWHRRPLSRYHCTIVVLITAWQEVTAFRSWVDQSCSDQVTGVNRAAQSVARTIVQSTVHTEDSSLHDPSLADLSVKLHTYNGFEQGGPRKSTVTTSRFPGSSLQCFSPFPHPMRDNVDHIVDAAKQLCLLRAMLRITSSRQVEDGRPRVVRLVSDRRGDNVKGCRPQDGGMSRDH
jgi:hypothetical protein